jgi:predicted outer membrane repeat protein
LIEGMGDDGREAIAPTVLLGEAMTTALSVRPRVCAALAGCMAIVALVVTSASVDAATITVNTFNEIAPGQCTIATAIASINAAADQVGCTHSGTYGTSDTIVLAAGTYALTTANNGTNGYPIIGVAVTINGNGATLSRTVGSVAPFFRFFEVGGGGLTLNNATLTGGNAPSGNGGAILVDVGPITLNVSGSTFSGNSSGGDGGAIFYNSTVGVAMTISNTTFTGNSGAGDGGAIFDNSDVGMTLTNTTFTGNSAVGDGGAIFDNSDDGMTVTNTTITGNSSSDGDGGGIFDNSDGGLAFNCGSVANNSAATGASGGGIFDNSDAGLRVTNVVFTGNTATGGNGGAIYNNASVGTGPVSSNSFVGNTATIGGGIFSNVTVLNAVNNWWGSASGPSGAGPGTGDAVSTDVTFAPFLTSPPSVCGASKPTPSQPIPMLSEWEIWTLSLLLLAGGMWAIRRQVR